jgi:hypothetical protein
MRAHDFHNVYWLSPLTRHQPLGSQPQHRHLDQVVILSGASRARPPFLPIGMAADLRFRHSAPRQIRVLSVWRP